MANCCSYLHYFFASIKLSLVISVMSLLLIPLFFRSIIASTIGFAFIVVAAFNGSTQESTLNLVEEKRLSVLLFIFSTPYMTSVFSSGILSSAFNDKVWT